MYGPSNIIRCLADFISAADGRFKPLTYAELDANPQRVRLRFVHRNTGATPAMFTYATYFIIVYGLTCWLIGRRKAVSTSSSTSTLSSPLSLSIRTSKSCYRC